MTQLRGIREKLGDKMKTQKKKKKKGKKGGLRSQNTVKGDAMTEVDTTSYYTKLSAEDNEMFAGILVDYCFTNFQ